MVSSNLKSSLNVLVVDGSCEITDILMRVLFCTGHCAKAFNDPAQALRVFKENPDEFDAIITDDFLLHTDEYAGQALLDAFFHIRKLPILVWSAHAARFKSSANGAFLSFLNKPEDLKNIFTWLGNIKGSVEADLGDHSPVYQLIYASRAVEGFCEKELMAILHTSRKSNKSAAISGVLIYFQHYFLQVLEGDEEVVTTLFHDHILKDKRHKDVAIFSEGYVDRRSFGNWSMGFFGQHQNEEYSLLGLTDFAHHPASAFFKHKLSDEQKGLLGLTI